MGLAPPRLNAHGDHADAQPWVVPERTTTASVRAEAEGIRKVIVFMKCGPLTGPAGRSGPSGHIAGGRSPEVGMTTAAVEPVDLAGVWTMPGVYAPQADTALLARALREEQITAG